MRHDRSSSAGVKCSKLGYGQRYAHGRETYAHEHVDESHALYRGYVGERKAFWPDTVAFFVDLRPSAGGSIEVPEDVQPKEENEDTSHTHAEGKPVHPGYHQEEESSQEKTDEAPLEGPGWLRQLGE